MTGELTVLFDIQHPAQVHLFRPTARELEARGHEVVVASREKELTTTLLDAYGFDHRVLSRRAERLPGLAGELLVREARMAELARSVQPDVVASRLSPAAAHAARLVDARCLIVTDTLVSSRAMRALLRTATLPFADVVCTPSRFELGFWAGRQRLLDFQELAYLHPDRFQPDRSVLADHGVPVDEPYTVLRLTAWDAYHDTGDDGLTPGAARRLFERLGEHGPVYVSAETETSGQSLPGEPIPVPPHLIHQLLYHATLYVGDSGTMATEAALLGTPAVRVTTAAGPGDHHAFQELERRWGLLQSFPEPEPALEAVDALLGGSVDRASHQDRRRRLAAEYGDPTDRLVALVLDLAAGGDGWPDAAGRGVGETDAGTDGDTATGSTVGGRGGSRSE